MSAESKWRQMMARSFSPQQWFVSDDPPIPDECQDGPPATSGVSGGDILRCQEGVRKMYVYRQTEKGVYTVGFYDPKGEWHPESDYPSQEQAAARVRWLHGGNN